MADPHGQADVLSPVHEEVVDDHLEHGRVVVGQVILALLYMVLLQAGTVVGFEILLVTENVDLTLTHSHKALTSTSAAPALTM